MKKTVLILTISLLALSSCQPGGESVPGDRADAKSGDTAPARVKNIILMIGDGCGFNQIEAASLYRFGKKNGQIYETFPHRYAMSTYSADGEGYDPERAWSEFDYVLNGFTDSAAAATAMATGAKTADRVVAMTAEGVPLKTILEQAEELGKATGVVTTVPISHATPAAFVAHNIFRRNYEQIAVEMLEASAIDVIMGAGHPLFDNNGNPVTEPNSFRYFGGPTVWEELQAGRVGSDADGDGTPDPWALIGSREEFRRLANGPTPKRILGVAQVFLTLQQLRDGTDDNITDDTPYQVPKIESVPTLVEMVLGAVNVLDNDPDGFVLMIEGGAIDWANEDNQGGRMIEEQIDFDLAVEAVVKWIESNSNWEETILIVTSDHESGCLTGPGSDPNIKPLLNNGVGKLPGLEWHSDTHTNSLVPIFASGSAATHLNKLADEIDPVRGRYLDNAELGAFIMGLLGRKVEDRPLAR